jgi:tetratricopeptide (TPR) repeat protein
LKARYAAGEGRLQEARSLLVQLEDEELWQGLDSSGRLDLGDLHVELGSLEQALASYETVAEEDPEGPLGLSALERMGQACFLFEEYGRAETFFRRAHGIAIDPDRKTSLESQRIVCLYRQGLMEQAGEARQAFQKQHGQESPAAAELLVEEGLAYLAGEDQDAAGKVFGDLIKTHPDSPAGRKADYQLGLMMLSSGDYQSALERFGALLERSPGTELQDLIHFKMGSALYGLEQYPDAARKYQQAADVTADDGLKVDALFNAAICRARMNDWDGAIGIYRQLLEEFPDHQDAGLWSLRLGFAYLEAGQPSQALGTFGQIDPGGDQELGAELQFWVGESYFKMGQYETAAQEYLRVAFLYPRQGHWTTTAQYNAGICYEQLGRTEEARTIYRKLAQALGSDDQWGHMARERLQELGEE